MGKIFCDFSVPPSAVLAQLPSGIDFRRIQEVVGSLPGDTIITSVFIHPIISNSQVFRVEMENNHFWDGTEIQAKYVRRASNINSSVVYYETFDGIDIIYTAAYLNQNQTVNVSGSTGQVLQNNALYIPTWSGGTGNGANNGNNPGNIITYNNGPGTVYLGTPSSSTPPTFRPLTGISPDMGKCTCGAEKVGGKCSDWCDKN